MIEIPDPPAGRACASCSSVIVWLYSPRNGKWVDFATDPTDRLVLRVHECRDRSAPRTWRDVPSPWEPAHPDQVERVHRGAAMVREVLATHSVDPDGGETP